MDSIYGGLPGQSFVLKDRFPSVEEMVSAFQKGSDYKKTWYGEYCIIDSPNKNHKDNGKIFRRGYNNLDQIDNVYGGGAIYVGRIVGPSAGTPYFEVMSVDELAKSSTTAKKNAETDEYSYYRAMGDKSGADIIINGAKENNTDLMVPGKDKDGKYHDTIRWGWYNIRKDQDTNLDETHGLADNNNDSESWFRIGFEFPYTTNTMQSVSVEQYDDNGNYVQDASRVVELMPDDGKPHTYHHDYSFLIPKGIRGDSIAGMQVVDASFVESHDVYEWNLDTNFEYVPSGSLNTRLHKVDDTWENIESHESRVLRKRASAQKLSLGQGVLSGMNGQNKILVYQVSTFGRKKEGESYWIFISPYENIQSMHVVDNARYMANPNHPWSDGYYQDYSYDSSTNADNDTLLLYSTGKSAPVVFPHIFRRISKSGIKFYNTPVQDAEVGNSGLIEVPFTDGTTYRNKVSYVDDVDLRPDGTWDKVSVGKARETHYKRYQWTTDFDLSQSTGIATVSYNNDTNGHENSRKEIQLDWIDGISLDDSGSITYHHTNQHRNPDVQEKKISWITGADININDGLFTISTNTGKVSLSKQLSWLKNLTIGEDGTVRYSFTNTDNDRTESKVLTWINEVSLNEETGEFNVVSNNGKADYTNKLSWIKNVDSTTKTYPSGKKGGVEHNRTVLTFEATDSKKNVVFENLLPHIDAAYFNKETGEFSFLNTNDELITSQDSVDTIKEIKWDKDTNQLSIASYLGSLNEHSESLQWIDKIEYSPSDFHLYALLNFRPKKEYDVFSQDKRALWNDFVPNPNMWKKHVGNGDVEAEWWVDLGAIKDDSGILIGENYDEKALKEEFGIDSNNYTSQLMATKLQEKYPRGIPEKAGVRRGKIITVTRKKGDSDKVSSEFFAYDYKNLSDDGSTVGEWYTLGGIDATGDTFYSTVSNNTDFDSEMTQNGSKATFNKTAVHGTVLLTSSRVADKQTDVEAYLLKAFDLA